MSAWLRSEDEILIQGVLTYGSIGLGCFTRLLPGRSKGQMEKRYTILCKKIPELKQQVDLIEEMIRNGHKPPPLHNLIVGTAHKRRCSENFRRHVKDASTLKSNLGVNPKFPEINYPSSQGGFCKSGSADPMIMQQSYIQLQRTYPFNHFMKSEALAFPPTHDGESFSQNINEILVATGESQQHQQETIQGQRNTELLDELLIESWQYTDTDGENTVRAENASHYQQPSTVPPTTKDAELHADPVYNYDYGTRWKGEYGPESSINPQKCNLNKTTTSHIDVINHVPQAERLLEYIFDTQYILDDSSSQESDGTEHVISDEHEYCSSYNSFEDVAWTNSNTTPGVMF